jgi:hypothetical protein
MSTSVVIADEFKLSVRIDEIMESMHSAYPGLRYYFGQKENSVNKSTNYIDFMPVSESVIEPHILNVELDGYSYDFCNTRIVTILARVHGKDIDTCSNILYGLIASLKITAGVGNSISVDWTSQTEETGVTRQGDLVDVRFNVKLPVPSLKSFLVTPEAFVISNVDFVDTLPDGYQPPITNEDLEIPPYYSSGETLVYNK